MARYRIEVSEEAAAELAELRAFDQRRIVQAIRELANQADVRTRNRRPLREPVGELPRVTWQVRVDKHRIFYEIRDEGTVRVLRVIIKRGTTEESL